MMLPVHLETYMIESRNPENELPDGRPLSKKIEDDGEEPKYDVTKQGIDGESKETGQSEEAEEKEQMEEGEERAEDFQHEKVETNTSQLLNELSHFQCRTMDDLRRIEQLVRASEGK